MPKPTSRIAPSPSGLIHLGNAYNFILTWWWVRFEGGRLLLRIDDIDAGRTRDAYLEDIFRSLEWLGIGVDEGPSGVEDFKENFSQRKKRRAYLEALRNLPTFVCRCRRSDVPDGAYPGTCRSKGLAWKPGLAVRWNAGGHNASLDGSLKDAVLWRKDDMPSYQLASVIDDRDGGVDFIVRGDDLRASGELQARLGQALGWDFPRGANLVHHPLVRDRQGRKLSKSSLRGGGPWTLEAWREGSGSPASLVALWAGQWGLGTAGISRLRDLLDHRPPAFGAH